MSYDTRFACCVVRSADARSMSSMLYDVSTGLSSCVGCGALGCEPSRRDLQVRAPFAGARVTSTRRDTSTRRAAHRTHRKSCVCTVFVRRSLIAAWFSLGSLCLYPFPILPANLLIARSVGPSGALRTAIMQRPRRGEVRGLAS